MKLKQPSHSLAKLGAFSLIAVLVLGVGFFGTRPAEANHPVLVEGNCDSPVPGTTLVASGTCGDFDGDGRIGTAEDTDGADRIFGTINAALGPGTGAAAGTGANQNGLVRIVASGRFAEAVYIGRANIVPPFGAANPGHVTLEAAPGVHAIIDAVFQGDPAGGNTARQAGPGIFIFYLPSEGDRRVTLRNLTIRNYNVGIDTSGAGVEVVDCRLENNLNYGIRTGGSSRLVVLNSEVVNTGFRLGAPNLAPNPGEGIGIRLNQATAKLVNTTVSYSFGAGIHNNLPSATALTLYKVSSFFNNGGNIIGPSTICTDAAPCQ
ncbi:MAG TPA: right-handed parallel beta-helix repeat-containing protein [Pyrinomonadaceae bacterium]|nr:right-handed parallel beta-helix repeat-containing protein [Pyrinomonadaceae bacterium]